MSDSWTIRRKTKAMQASYCSKLKSILLAFGIVHRFSMVSVECIIIIVFVVSAFLFDLICLALLIALVAGNSRKIVGVEKSDKSGV